MVSHNLTMQRKREELRLTSEEVADAASISFVNYTDLEKGQLEADQTNYTQLALVAQALRLTMPQVYEGIVQH